MSKTAPLGDLPLFHTCGPDPRARTGDPDTSHSAAASMREGAESHRRAILDALLHGGPMTGDALDERLGWNHATANRRLPELREAGLVEMTAEKAVTRSGRFARLWRLTPRPLA